MTEKRGARGAGSRSRHSALKNFATGGEGVLGLLAEAGVAVSLRRPDIRDDVLGGNLAGEAAVETSRH